MVSRVAYLANGKNVKKQIIITCSMGKHETICSIHKFKAGLFIQSIHGGVAYGKSLGYPDLRLEGRVPQYVALPVLEHHSYIPRRKALSIYGGD